MTPRPTQVPPRWIVAVLAVLALAALALPLLIVRTAPPIAPAVAAKLAAARPHRVVPQAELPLVEPTAFVELAPTDARAFNATVPFSTAPNPAARPFRITGDPASQTRAVDCLAAGLIYEAGDDAVGEKAVAQVILNRVRHPTFPGTVCGVVYQGSEKRGCQFSFACDGALARAPMRAAWDRARRAAARALAGYVFAPVGMATHYHTYAVTPSWNRSLVMTGVFGAHFFHRWKGYWGTPGAFRQAYAGGEPLPGPHARLDAPLVAATPATAPAIARAAVALLAQPTPAAQVQPEHAASGALQDRFVASTDESQILDKWKDSGKPLR